MARSSRKSKIERSSPQRDDCILSVDRELKLTALNANARERLGMGEECIGSDATKLFPLTWATYAREVVEDALSKGLPAHFHFYGRELGAWFDIRVLPTPEGIDVIFRDLTGKPSVPRSTSLSQVALDRVSEEMRHSVARTIQLASAQADLHEERASSDSELAWIADLIYRNRRERAKILPIESSEPQWDILLDLFIQANRNNRVSVTGACIAADVPTSTALRALRELMSMGLVTRAADVTDKRRTWVGLTREGTSKMRQYLRYVATR
jgi:DNA-binding MarR family transcriptional regulator